MHTFKYHAANIAAVMFFSFVCAVTINTVVRFVLAPVQFIPSTPASSAQNTAAVKPQIDVNAIVNSGFFRLASPESTVSSLPAASDLSDLVLMATMLGPDSVACAMIKKKSDNAPKIFMYKDRWKDDVFGYKLIRISKTTVTLKSGDQVVVLDMYAPPAPPAGSVPNQQPGGEKLKKTISRSDLQQRIKNNMDTMLQGLRAGPYLVNGKIDGYKLFIVQPDNYLYLIGARSGDVIKRINGHPIDSTEKLYKIWQTLPQESRVLLDLDRGGQTVSYDYTFTE